MLRYYNSWKNITKKYSNEDTIFIYQMGKVGSSSLESSIENSIHVHSFFPKNHICMLRDKAKAGFGIKYYFSRMKTYIHGWLIRKIIRKRPITKIITLVRDPVARNISQYFHDLDAYLFSAHINFLGNRPAALMTRNQQVGLLPEVFESEFPHNYPLCWFDQELKQMTQLDIYSEPFNKSEGYSVIKNANFEVLCLRLDKLDANIDRIEKFIGIGFQLNNCNRAEEKWYSFIYQNFKSHFKFSNQLVANKMLVNQFVEHFFTQAEQEDMLSKYTVKTEEVSELKS